MLSPWAPELLAQEDFEARLKTELIDRFVRFIEWPQEAGEWSRKDLFVVCDYGRSALEQPLRELVRDALLRDRRAVLRSVSKPDQVDACQVVFVSPDIPAAEEAKLLAAARGRPILTIGDRPGFAQSGGIINFFRRGDFVRFEIHELHARQSGLTFSSKLLRLATLVGNR